MNWKWLRKVFVRREVRRVAEVETQRRDETARDQISELQRRKAEVEGYLIPRQRRNHWQEAVAHMIHSGRH